MNCEICDQPIIVGINSHPDMEHGLCKHCERELAKDCRFMEGTDTPEDLEEGHYCERCDAVLPNTKEQIELANAGEKYGFGMVCQKCAERMEGLALLNDPGEEDESIS